MANVGSEEWNRYCREYVEAMERGTTEGWAHAGCDHGEGYCAVTWNNAYVGKG